MQKGFIIVEWMIQFLLCTLIGLIAFTLFRTWSARLSSLHRSLDTALQLPTVHDVLKRDLQSAPRDMIEVQSDRCKISKPGQQIVWRFKNSTLFRVQKKYDAGQEKWRKAVQNVAVEHLSGCGFVALYAGAKTGGNTKKLSGVRMVCNEGKVEYLVSLYNGTEL